MDLGKRGCGGVEEGVDGGNWIWDLLYKRKPYFQLKNKSHISLPLIFW